MKIAKYLKQVLAVVIVLAIGVGSGAYGAYLYHHKHPFGTTVIKTLSSVPKIVEASSTGLTIPSLVKQYNPAVVSITTQGTVYGFFGGPITQSGAGSGMILTSTGYILTNYHVVPSGTTSLTVTLSDQTTYSGTIVATDPNNDLALVKINATGLSTVSLGNSDTINVGDSVIAIGNALGQFLNTVTNGIISATGRTVTASDSQTGSNETLNNLF